MGVVVVGVVIADAVGISGGVDNVVVVVIADVVVVLSY